MKLFGPPNIQKLTLRRDIRGLLKAIEHREGHVAVSAAIALGELGEPTSIEPLKELLFRGSPPHRVRASLALETMMTHARVPVDVQKHVISALSSSANPRALRPLDIAKQRQHGVVRDQILSARQQLLQESSTDTLVGFLLDGSEPAALRKEIVATLGSRADPRVPAVLRSVLTQEHLGEAALAALARSAVPEAFQSLIGVLTDTSLSESLRGAAALAVGRVRDSRGVPYLVTALRDETSSHLRWCAAEALGELRHSDAVASLIDCLERDANDSVRSRVAEALGKIGDPNAVPALVGALHSSDHWLQQSAAEALGNLHDYQATGPLLEVLRSQRGRQHPGDPECTRLAEGS